MRSFLSNVLTDNYPLSLYAWLEQMQQHLLQPTLAASAPTLEDFVRTIPTDIGLKIADFQFLIKQMLNLGFAAYVHFPRQGQIALELRRRPNPVLEKMVAAGYLRELLKQSKEAIKPIPEIRISPETSRLLEIALEGLQEPTWDNLLLLHRVHTTLKGW